MTEVRIRAFTLASARRKAREMERPDYILVGVRMTENSRERPGYGWADYVATFRVIVRGERP